jgi:hypothetical protein
VHLRLQLQRQRQKSTGWDYRLIWRHKHGALGKRKVFNLALTCTVYSDFRMSYKFSRVFVFRDFSFKHLPLKACISLTLVPHAYAALPPNTYILGNNRQTGVQRSQLRYIKTRPTTPLRGRPSFYSEYIAETAP